MLCRSAAYSAMFNLFIMKQNFSISFSARLHRAVQLCALLGILLSFSSNAWAYGENTSYVLNESSEHTGKSSNVIYETTNITASPNEGILTFYAKVSSGLAAGKTLTIYSYDGSSWSQIATKEISTTNTKYTFNNFPTDSRGLRIKAGSTAYTQTVSQIQVKRATTFSASTNSLNLGTTGVNKELSGIVTLNFNNTDYPQQITASSDTAVFTVSFVNSTAGETGSTTATIKFNSAIAGDYSGNITFNMNGKSATVAVTAKATEAVITSINWVQNFMSLSIYDDPVTIDLSASVVDQQGHAVPGANVVYSLGDDADGVVSLNGNQLTIVGVGKTTITATYTSDDEDQYTSSSNTKRIVVGDGSACVTYLVEDHEQHSINYASGNLDYSLNKPADTLTFNISKRNNSTTGQVQMFFLGDGDRELQKETFSVDNLSTSAQLKTFALPIGTKKIRYNGGSTGTLAKFVQDVVVTQATYLEAVSTSLNATGEGVASTSVSFNFSNLPTAVSASLEGNHDEISLDPASVGEGCGDWQDGATMHLTFRPNGSGSHTYRYNGNLVLSAGSGENITSVKIPLSVTISMPYGEFKNNLAMFYNANEVVLDTHTSAYWAVWNDDNTTLSIQAIDGKNVAAEMPVLLVGDGTNAFYTFTKEDEPTLNPEDNNAFYYTSKAETAVDPVVFFVLGVKDGVAAFYKFTGEVPAGKVVLKMTKTDSQAAVPARIDIELNEQTATALRPVYADEQAEMNGQIFTIMGLPVSSMDQPGIYIMNGKKYIVR